MKSRKGDKPCSSRSVVADAATQSPNMFVRPASKTRARRCPCDEAASSTQDHVAALFRSVAALIETPVPSVVPEVQILDMNNKPI